MGKIIKNIILVLIGFLIISVLVAAFIGNDEVKEVPLSEITALIQDEKVESLQVNPSSIDAKLKDSDSKITATIGPSTEIPQYFIDSGIATDKISKVKIEFQNTSFATVLAGSILPFLIPFLLIGLFIYFLMR